SAALAQNVEHDEIADGARHAKARSHGMSVLELRRFVPTVIEGADDWRATGGLHAEHSRALRPDSPYLFHFVKGLPHADEARASAGRIEDHVRQFPIELLDQLVSHRLLAFDAIRLLQSRNVEPAFALFTAGHPRPGLRVQGAHDTGPRP